MKTLTTAATATEYSKVFGQIFAYWDFVGQKKRYRFFLFLDIHFHFSFFDILRIEE